MSSIRTKAGDYQTVIEGVGYAKRVFSQKESDCLDIINMVATDEYMGGETGKEFADKLRSIGKVVAALNVKMDKLIAAIAAKSDENKTWLNGAMSSGFESAEKGFSTLGDLISDTKINGKPKS